MKRFNKFLLGKCLLICSLFMTTAMANAQQYNVAILGGNPAVDLSYPADALMATGYFNTVDEIDLYNGLLLNVETLNLYDAVLIYTNYNLPDPIMVGDTLAAYIDQGGAVVSSVFDIAIDTIGGKFNNSTYRVLMPLGQVQEFKEMGTVHLPNHEIMEGVQAFAGVSNGYYSTSTTLSEGSFLIAEYTDGAPMIMAKENVGPSNARRVDLNFWPAQVVTPTGGLIMGNALLWVINDETCEESMEFIEVNACESYTMPGNNQTLTESGTYNDTLTSILGCDSIVVVDLSIPIFDIGISAENSSISADASDVSYQWLDCNNAWAPIQGEISQTLTPSVNGDFAVELTKNGCADTSQCVNVSNVGFDDKLFEVVTIYPNPTRGLINIDLGELTNVNLQVHSIEGALIYEERQIQSRDFQFKIDGPSAVYFLTLSNAQARKEYKLLVE